MVSRPLLTPLPALVIPILQVTKLRHGEVQWLAQARTPSYDPRLKIEREKVSVRGSPWPEHGRWVGARALEAGRAPGSSDPGAAAGTLASTGGDAERSEGRECEGRAAPRARL